MSIIAFVFLAGVAALLTLIVTAEDVEGGL